MAGLNCNDFTQELEKIVTCAICNDIVTEPKTLPCLHTFCFTCIQSWNQACKKEKKTFKCPSCRAPITVQNGDVANLPTSFQHTSLVQLYNTIKNKTSDQQKLQQCISCSKRYVVVGFCFQCEGLLCIDCMNAHKTMNTLKNTHQAALWNEFKKENMNSYIDHKSLCQEKYHEKTRLEYYCQTCKKCICQKCAATAHSTHNKVSIEEAAEHHAEKVIDQLIDKMFKNIYKKKMELSRENRDRIKDAGSQTGRNTVKYKAQKPLPYKVALSMGGKPISNSPQNVDTIDATAEIKPVWVYKSAGLSRPLALAVSDRCEMAILNDDVGSIRHVVLYSADGEYLREFGEEGTGESRLSDPLGVAFDDDRLLISYCQDGYGCIKEFDIHGNYNRTICKQKGMKFRRMCTIEQSIACLTYGSDTFIKLISRQTGYLLQDIKLRGIRDVGNPWDFAYDNNKYFVCFSNSNSIYVFDENGGLLYTFGEKGNRENLFRCPDGLDVFGADMLFVCDFHNHSIHLWHQDGTFIRSFVSRGSRRGEMIGPLDVAVTTDGQVFVLEILVKRVQVLR